MNSCTMRTGVSDVRVSFTMDDRERWRKAKDALKVIPGSRWHAAAKEWSIPIAGRGILGFWAARWFDASEIHDHSRDGGPRREAPQRPASPLDAAYRTLHLQPGAPPWAIAAMYRAAAKELHPDAGGSHEHMVQVNRAVEALRKAGVTS